MDYCSLPIVFYSNLVNVHIYFDRPTKSLHNFCLKSKDNKNPCFYNVPVLNWKVRQSWYNVSLNLPSFVIKRETTFRFTFRVRVRRQSTLIRSSSYTVWQKYHIKIHLITTFCSVLHLYAWYFHKTTRIFLEYLTFLHLL